MNQKEYLEDFDRDTGGWWAFISNFKGAKSLEWSESVVISRSPWWVDYNHAPPGSGYMHMLANLNTAGAQTEATNEIAGPNRFIADRYPTNFTNAKLSLRLKGELLLRGARFGVLIQGNVDGIISGWLLTGKSFEVGQDWSEQTVTLDPDPGLWTALGCRHGRTDMYGRKSLQQVLNNVNVNVMLVLFPLEVVPMGPIDGDLHRLRAGHDYPLWQSKLPEGYVMFDWVKITFAESD